jgi:hypothetical protein
MNFRKDEAFHGLLAHAEHILRSTQFNYHTDDPFIFFSSFVEELGFSKMCVLLTDENQFKVFFSCGFNSETFEKAVSTKDFWDGTIPQQDEWFSVSDEDVVSFRQLFSDSDNAEISMLHIKKIEVNGEPCIIIIAENTKQSLVDTDMVDVVLPYLIPHIPNCLDTTRITSGSAFATKCETAVNAENSLIENAMGFMFSVSLDKYFESFENLTPEAKQLLFKSLHYAISILTKLPDIIYADNNTIKIIRFSNNDLDEELYAYQLKKTVSPIFAAEKAELIDIQCLGSATDINELADFLQR